MLLGRLVKERTPPNLAISVISYENTVFVLREFVLRGSFQEGSNGANRELPYPTVALKIKAMTAYVRDTT